MNSSKSLQTSLRSAVALMLPYALYLPVRHIPLVEEFLLAHSTFEEVVVRGCSALLLLSIIATCISIFVHRRQLPTPDKQLRILSHIAAWSSLAIVLIPSSHVMWTNVIPVFYVEWWLMEIIVLLSACFVWKYSNLPMGEDSLPKSLSTLVISAAVLSIFVLLLMFVAGCYVLCTGHVIGDGIGTFGYFSWIRALVPAILFPCYAIHITSVKKLRKQKL